MFSMSDGGSTPARDEAVVAGPNYRFTVLSSRLIRMEWHSNGTFVDNPTQVVVNRDFDVPEFKVVETTSGIEIVTRHLRLRYDGRPFSSSGLSVSLLKGASDPHYATWRFDEQLPESPPHRGNLLGTARTLDEVDGACTLEPGVLATYGFAVLDDSTSVLLTEDGWIAPRAPIDDVGAAPSHDFYLFGHGRDYRAALGDFHTLTGPIPLVPRYVLGNWWSRFWRYSDSEYLLLMDRFRQEEIPLSVAVIDMDWHLVDIDPDVGTGWTGYTWNPELFPDPPAFLKALHDRDLAVTLNVHPADGVRNHEARYPEMALAMGIDPEAGTAVEFDVTSRAFVDAYLTHLHHPLESDGVDFWWIDWQSGGTTRIPGLDPLWMLNHIHYKDSAREGRRPLIFSRYSGPGSHRYPVGFSGDTIATWASLDFQPYFTATAANIGYSWWSHDIGGHMQGTHDIERAVRWLQLGVFSPVNRLHSSNSTFSSKEPWAYGPRARDIMRRFLRLRHRLVPYLYTAAWASHVDHVSLVRPMYHEHTTSSEAYEVPNQTMVGEHLLVAPITSPEGQHSHLAKVKVWLPEGSWFDLFTGRRYIGGRTTFLHRSLESYPVLVRGGAVLPLQPDPLADITRNPETLNLRVFPGNATSHLAEDDITGVPTLTNRCLTRIEQQLQQHQDGRADLVLVVHPPSGGVESTPRDLTIDIVGATSVDSIELYRGGMAVLAPIPTEMGDELLSRALRLDLTAVDMSIGTEIHLKGLHAARHDITGDVTALLRDAEIAVAAKHAALGAVLRLEGLSLAQELATISLPRELREAITEMATVEVAW